MNSPQPTIRSGLEIPYLDGTNDHLVFSREHWNQIIAVVNSILISPYWTVTQRGVILDFLSNATGGFTGEYDQSKRYSSGQTFLISSGAVIAGITVVAGYYGVPPAGDDVNGLPWSGYVPASPTGNAVPQSPLPSIGAAPNDRFYAKLIMPIC
ncbi:MAG: hypothetical protein KGL39_42220 [Patescibacteria group bacterium]|nr:hypothetical protein [Patescibacteria group bacterium]